MLRIVILILTVYNADTGDVLYTIQEQMPGFSISGDRIEECRKDGVRRADQLTQRYRQKFPNATTNVDCEWHDAASSDPA